MTRPSRLEILEYALEGAQTQRGIWSGEMGVREEAELDAHIDWLEREIARVKGNQE
jgi:hypothetical protein